ncbi:MAG: hypothetical protein ACJ748_06690, partial [Flavisolibacter sp.]
MVNRKSLWISLCLFNLCIVAFFGLALRSKILFPLPFINYRDVLSAHSHFAFAGWAGLSLITLLIYDLLPEASSQKKIYQWILIVIEVSSLGMALSFPFYGYNAVSIIFSTLYIIATLVFAPVFIKDVINSLNHRTVKLLSIAAVSSLIISFLGTLGLAYILMARSHNSLLYRDSIYTFLHFQYNGFFTLSVFALFFASVLKKNASLNRNAILFSVFLCFSIVPSLALSLLWHNNTFLYVFAAIGCICVLISLAFFFSYLRQINQSKLFSSFIAETLWRLSVFSFSLKMLLNVGTIFPKLGNAVYGDRPVIIGFLHLVFLGFLTFYLLATFIQSGYFTSHNKVITYPFIVFSFGILINEFLLMLQGLSILLETN